MKSNIGDKGFFQITVNASLREVKAGILSKVHEGMLLLSDFLSLRHVFC